MDYQPSPDAESIHSTTCDPESPSHASGMFSHSAQFTVTGGTFTNIMKSYAAAPSLPSDFRMIPMGDIDLCHRIQVDECTGAVNSQPHERACVRRVHSAKARIDGRTKRVTVAIYQGNTAEEEWRQDIAQYMRLRHPNIVQICGAASSNGIHATLFNDDLILLEEVLDRYKNSHFSTIYIYAHCSQDFREVHNYIYSAFQRALYPSQCTNWIRRSTGRLCAELTNASDNLRIYFNISELPGLSRIYPVSAEAITTFIDLLTVKQYHHICGWNLGQHQTFTYSVDTNSVDQGPGAVFHCSWDPLEDSIEIAFLPSAEAPRLGDWSALQGGTGEVMPNSWTRLAMLLTAPCIPLGNYFNPHSWLSQANHIFHRLRIMSNFKEYVRLNYVSFRLKICKSVEDPPPGFLFLCPKEDFQTGSSSFCWPACPAYWSLDPSGVDCLSPEAATRLGFPLFELTITTYGYSWDASVYEGLRQFHQAKGFDPYSQDVAQHLGLPLYVLSSQGDVLSARDGQDFSAYTESGPAYEDSDIGTEFSDNEEDIQSLGNADYGSVSGKFQSEFKSADKSNFEPRHAPESTVRENRPELLLAQEDMPAPSCSLKFLVNAQLVLILFLALSWAYEHV
ncbi:hypothetical protein MSAN_00129700 [Mycena sanguinolenta]|uniref:Protein kinase domain-containing protein n=1 Tax=Mycena sanguinolenta TaxID=230812 RepID=A0A8H6ZGR3_9AGAR|nr:hypothetical protein MSAN_00129700 [Mycena sanguinolenta]